MDLVQNGGSSKSPRAQAQSQSRNQVESDVIMDNADLQRTSNFILPQWDIPPPRHLHSSQDLISLLHLDTLYNTYVRPYAEQNPDDNADVQGGDKKNINGPNRQFRRKKMEKGYWHLIEDCIDPTPTGTKIENQSLLPISQDFMNPTGIPPNLFADQIQMLPTEAFQVATLEVGLKEDGYSGGIKVGVREAEERRKKKRAAKLSIGPISSNTELKNQGSHVIPSPSLPSPSFPYQIPGQSNSTPGTPLLPVLPPQKFPNQNTFSRKTSFPSNINQGQTQGIKPFPIKGQNQYQSGQGKPYNPNKRPGSIDFGNSNSQKRVKSGSVGPVGSGSRSASPMPSNSQGQGSIQGSNKIKIGMRSKTEGI
ncbi:uncharacterized protein I206_102341 [Kwoniella pini CBS 10737]|uniref:Mediator of RNA polymerase II transcription subunit 19 n=1 Tax=Kwoniella pini CBS 10737 TaxID=1296096 RepID=A0A1B9I519_9TREE|nr:uncharacterized protein I206_02688 [Kwoniella pini CBS 10737]OCF50634.1 hypothetical protein I206_02688 [Kwoniella pini CBS 10737]